MKQLLKLFKKNETINSIIEKKLKSNYGFFIQIGSNNGINNDPLRKFIIQKKIEGILIEPVKYIYETLKENYKDYKNLIFVNAAISDLNGERDFYRLKKNEDNLPIWYDQLGSFLPEVILKHEAEIPNIGSYMIKEKVECLTLESLLNRYDVKKVDILHIDTEGYDYQILKLINFKILKPSIIIYEHKHLSTNDYDKSQSLLKSNGYRILKIENDSIAILNK